MKFNPIIRLVLFSLLLLLEGCAIDHANYVKNMKKLDASEYSKIQIGSVQNFTAVKMRVFDRKMQHEVSNSNDPGVQAQVANHENVVYYSDNTAPITMRFTPAPTPDDIDPSWDKYAIRDISETPEFTNYVALGRSTVQNGVTRTDEKDYVAKITDKGDVIFYSDANETFKLLKRPMLSGEIHSDWDAYYLSEDGRYGLLRSAKKGTYTYRLFFNDPDGLENRLDFMPMAQAFQSSQYGTYLGIMYSPIYRKWYMYDYIPTKKLICFDLARAYDTATNARKQELTRAALTGLAIALGGYSRTTFRGRARSSYNGYYARNNWSGMRSPRFTGYARTYNYSYLAFGVAHFIDTAFKANATVDNVIAAIQQQQCGFDV